VAAAAAAAAMMMVSVHRCVQELTVDCTGDFAGLSILVVLQALWWRHSIRQRPSATCKHAFDKLDCHVHGMSAGTAVAIDLQVEAEHASHVVCCVRDVSAGIVVAMELQAEAERHV
jgi:hypothetical protein